MLSLNVPGEGTAPTGSSNLMIDSKPESMNPITPIASSLAPLRPPGLAIPPRLGYAHQPVSFKAYPEAKPRKRPLSEDEIVPAVRVVLPAIKQPSGERIPAVFHAVKASVTAKEALAMSSEKFTFKVLYTLQPILALGFLATAIADVIQADLAVVDAVVFSLASGFTALGAYILWTGLSLMDRPVEASKQQRTMLLGREEVQLFTTLQVFLTGVYALFLFNGTRLADSVMSCDSSMLGLVQRALNSCGPKAVVEAVLAALLVATSFVGSLAGLSSVLKYNERSKINTRSRLMLASSQRQPANVSSREPVSSTVTANDTPENALMALLVHQTDEQRQSSVLTIAAATITIITAVGSIALSFHFPAQKEKVIVQLSAVQCIALIVLVFMTACVRKTFLYGVAFIFSVWSSISLVNSVVLVARFTHASAVACATSSNWSSGTQHAIDCRTDPLVTTLYYSFCGIGIACSVFMSYVLLNMAMKSVTLSIIQAECMSPGHTTENPAITASSHSIFKQKKVSPQNSSDESNAVSVRVEK